MTPKEDLRCFFGVYFLYSTNPKYKGRTYIGFTVNPSRRIKQHNKGKKAGGAWRTSDRGPWEMVLIVYGFPNEISALRFEWAWQHPERSRRLRHLLKKQPREKRFNYGLRILFEMINTRPWSRLSLTVRWLSTQLELNFQRDKLMLPPAHIKIIYGSLEELHKSDKKPHSAEPVSSFCMHCNDIILPSYKKLACLNERCQRLGHISCWAEHLVTEDEIVPLESVCPLCNTSFLWGDLVLSGKTIALPENKYNYDSNDSSCSEYNIDFCLLHK